MQVLPPLKNCIFSPFFGGFEKLTSRSFKFKVLMFIQKEECPTSQNYLLKKIPKSFSGNFLNVFPPKTKSRVIACPIHQGVYGILLLFQTKNIYSNSHMQQLAIFFFSQNGCKNPYLCLNPILQIGLGEATHTSM